MTPHAEGAGKDTASTALERLAAYSAALSWEYLSEPVRVLSQELVLDLLGVLIRGSTEPSTGPVRAVAGTWLDEAGASAAGVVDRVIPPAAALINGSAAHALELDDVVRESSLHPGIAVIPAALAVGESRDVAGSRLLEAVVAGYETTLRVGSALNPRSAYARGFHPTGVAGVFGAASAAARLMDLDGRTTASALGIAGTMASGSMEYLSDGSWTKRLNGGWAAHAGVIAAALAAAGFTGPPTALEGRFGVLHAYSDDAHPELLAGGLGDYHRITQVAIKPYASCRYNHALVDAALILRQREAITPADVRRITLGVLSAGLALVAEPIERKRNPTNIVDAQFSAPYAVASALAFGAAGIDEYTPRRLSDPDVRALMSRTDIKTDRELDAVYPQQWPATVEIETVNGRVVCARVDHALGEPENPLSRTAVLEKFRTMVAGRIPESYAQRLEELVLGPSRSHSAKSIGHILRESTTKAAADE